MFLPARNSDKSVRQAQGVLLPAGHLQRGYLGGDLVAASWMEKKQVRKRRKQSIFCNYLEMQLGRIVDMES